LIHDPSHSGSTVDILSTVVIFTALERLHRFVRPAHPSKSISTTRRHDHEALQEFTKMDRDPIDPVEAKKLIRAIMESGEVVPSKHFTDEANKDELTIVDAENVLRAESSGNPSGKTALGGTKWRHSVSG
jgi:hypothetical protein